MKKVEIAKKLIRENIEMFMCPKCGEAMNLNDSNSLVCVNRHSFDLSRKGYVNLLLNSVKTEYDKNMLESRNIICKSGFFQPMIKKIVDILSTRLSAGSGGIRILDVGCGEGSHLSDIISGLHNKTQIDFQGVGIDISKEGIQIAAREYPGVVWCVADLARNPFSQGQFDAILNIFSPSNYGEFNRILKREGILLKVVPGSEYLKELREAFYEDTDKESYSNERVVNLFRENYDIIETLPVKYRAEVEPENLEHLVRMTPLSWGADESRIQDVLAKGMRYITVDVYVIVGKRKEAD